jgi:transcriptional regulator with XRE-family HTH domain
MSFGDKLRELREKKGVTQQDLADFLGVGRPTIAGYETKNKQPDYDKLVKIADYFNVPIDYLLGRIDRPNILIIQEDSSGKKQMYVIENETPKIAETSPSEDDIFEIELAANMEAEYGEKPSPEFVAMAKKIYKKVLREIKEEEDNFKKQK